MLALRLLMTLLDFEVGHIVMIILSAYLGLPEIPLLRINIKNHFDSPSPPYESSSVIVEL